MPGSEHVSPVSSAANYPPSMAGAASLTTDDAIEDDAAAELATDLPEMDTEKDIPPADVKNDDEGTDEPVSEQGKLAASCLKATSVMG